jgi:hypothetical protein
MNKIIECFIQRANNELPFGYSVADDGTCVKVFKEEHPIYLFSYEGIESDITGCLDLLPEVL